MEGYNDIEMNKIILLEDSTNVQFIFIMNDKLSFAIDDDKSLIWKDKEQKFLRPKRKKTCIVIITFLCLYYNLIEYSDDMFPNNTTILNAKKYTNNYFHNNNLQL